MQLRLRPEKREVPTRMLVLSTSLPLSLLSFLPASLSVGPSQLTLHPTEGGVLLLVFSLTCVSGSEGHSRGFSLLQEVMTLGGKASCSVSGGDRVRE